MKIRMDVLLALFLVALTLYALAGFQAQDDLRRLALAIKSQAPGTPEFEVDGVLYTSADWEHHTARQQYLKLYPWIRKLDGVMLTIALAATLGLFGAGLRQLREAISRTVDWDPWRSAADYVAGAGLAVAVLYGAAAVLEMPTGERTISGLKALPFLCICAGLFTEETVNLLRAGFQKIQESLGLRKASAGKDPAAGGATAPPTVPDPAGAGLPPRSGQGSTSLEGEI